MLLSRSEGTRRGGGQGGQGIRAASGPELPQTLTLGPEMGEPASLPAGTPPTGWGQGLHAPTDREPITHPLRTVGPRVRRHHWGTVSVT